MKYRLCLLTFFLAFYNFSYCQESWNKIELVDEFGDKTGKTAYEVIVDGTWTDNSTQNEGQVEVKLVKKNNRFIEVSIFLNGERINFSKDVPEGDNKSFAIEHIIYGTCRVKFANGNKSILNAQALYLWDYSFALIMNGKLKKEFKKPSGAIKVVVDESLFNAGNKKYSFQIPN